MPKIVPYILFFVAGYIILNLTAQLGIIDRANLQSLNPSYIVFFGKFMLLLIIGIFIGDYKILTKVYRFRWDHMKSMNIRVLTAVSFIIVVSVSLVPPYVWSYWFPGIMRMTLLKVQETHAILSVISGVLFVNIMKKSTSS